MSDHGPALFMLGLIVARVDAAIYQDEILESNSATAISLLDLVRSLSGFVGKLDNEHLAPFVGHLEEQATGLDEIRARFIQRKQKLLEGHRQAFEAALPVISEFGLDVSADLLGALLSKKSPLTSEEVLLVERAINTELKKKIFVFVANDRSEYYNNQALLTPDTALKFPSCHKELVEAGSCYSLGFSTAAVFHAMRAAEIGVRLVGKGLGVTFSYPIDLAEWGKIIGEIESKLTLLKAGPRSHEKDADLQFYSHAAALLRHFNNAWRIRASHAREDFTDARAREVIDHVRSLFELLAERLSEVA